MLNFKCCNYYILVNVIKRVINKYLIIFEKKLVNSTDQMNYWMSSHVLKKKYLLLCSVFLLCLNFTQSQTRSFAGLPQFRPKTPIEYKDNLNHTDEYDHILGIYERLVEAKGDRRMSVPKLSLRKEEGYVASVDYHLADISLEKKAYDVAKKYGDQAIAFLLSHELIHYYEKHGWRKQFSDEVSDLETSRVLKLTEDGYSNEVQADVLGGFLAYSAGFGLFDKGDSLINALYKGYGFTDQMTGYPSKQDRIELSKRNKIQIEKMTSIFEAATYMTIIGKYNEAYAYYGHLLNRYQSAELYNNAGLTCLLSGVSKLDSTLIPFRFPFFADLEFNRGSRNASVRSEVQITVDEAIAHFKSANIMNPAHMPSYINLVSAYLIHHIASSDKESRIRSLASAKFTLETEISKVIALYEDRDYSTFEDEFNILRSLITFYEMGDKNTANALTFLENPLKNGNLIAEFNANVLKKAANPRTDQNLSGVRKPILIDQSNAEIFLKNKRIPKNLTYINEESIFRFVDTKQNNIILLCENKGNNTDLAYDLVFFTNKNLYKGTVLDGLKIGDHKQKYIEKLGQPAKIFNHLEGEILFFSPNVILVTDGNMAVTKVVDFYEKK